MDFPTTTTTDGDDDDGDSVRFSQSPQSKSRISSTATTNQGDVNITLCSIASAIRKHRNRRNDCNTVSDIVAVILSTTTQGDFTTDIMASSTHHRPPKGRYNVPYITLLISDQSLPYGKCARITIPASCSHVSSMAMSSSSSLAGTKKRFESHSASIPDDNVMNITGTSLGELQPGDIVRFNRLEVRQVYYDDSDSTLGRKRSFDGSTSSLNDLNTPIIYNIICDFVKSWKDPPIGPTLARLCRIIPKSSSNDHDHNEVDDNLAWEMIIPPSLETPKIVISELAYWHCHKNARYSSLQSKNHSQINQRCQKRKLREITTANLLSHIVVKVVRCEMTSSAAHSARNKNKLEDTDMTYATLFDGQHSDDIMGIVGFAYCGTVGVRIIPKSISDVILQSLNDGAYVLLTHVLSQASTRSGMSSIILVPTMETTATVVNADHPFFVHRPSENDNVNLNGNSQHLFDITQHDHQSFEELTCNPTVVPYCIHPRQIITVTASILDIIVNGVDTSFMEGLHYMSPFALSRFLIDTPQITAGVCSVALTPSYRSASLMLDQKTMTIQAEKCDEIDNICVVHACGDSMKLLCLDAPVEDMVVQDASTTTLARRKNDAAQHFYLHHVGNLLKILCTEDIPIRWVLEQESYNNWFVINATLIEI